MESSGYRRRLPDFGGYVEVIWRDFSQEDDMLLWILPRVGRDTGKRRGRMPASVSDMSTFFFQKPDGITTREPSRIVGVK